MAATDPSALPAIPPPPIADAQRNRVLAAEDELSGQPRLGPREAQDLARRAAAETGLAPIVVSIDEAAPWRVGYRDGRLELAGASWRPTDVLHGVAHHAVPPTFPAHGAEFAAALVGLCERFAPDAAAPLTDELDARGVYRDARGRVARARRTAVYAAGKEEGVLARIVLDSPPEEVVAQLIRVGDDGLVVRDDRGEREVEMERLRYISYRFSGSGGSRV